MEVVNTAIDIGGFPIKYRKVLQIFKEYVIVVLSKEIDELKKLFY
jgi:hypothetical protein